MLKKITIFLFSAIIAGILIIEVVEESHYSREYKEHKGGRHFVFRHPILPRMEVKKGTIDSRCLDVFFPGNEWVPLHISSTLKYVKCGIRSKATYYQLSNGIIAKEITEEKPIISSFEDLTGAELSNEDKVLVWFWPSIMRKNGYPETEEFIDLHLSVERVRPLYRTFRGDKFIAMTPFGAAIIAKVENR